MNIPWKIVIPVFLAGLLAGAAGGSWAQRAAFRHFRSGGPMAPRRFIDHFSRELSLDETQRVAVQAIFEKHAPQLEALRLRTAGEFDAIRKSMDEEIKQKLNPDQQRRFEEMTARFMKRMPLPPMAGMPPPPGGMPPPPDHDRWRQ